MELKRNLWTQALKLEKEIEKRNGKITRKIIQDTLKIPQNHAQHIIYALENKDTINNIKPSNYTYIDKKAIGICDLHIPFHHSLSLNSIIEYGQKNKIDTIIINGDLIDCYKLSRFTKRSGKKDVSFEIEEAKKFLHELRYQFPKADIIFKAGNHDLHLERYICEKAPEIADLLENLLQEKLNLHDLNIVFEREPFKIGKLWFIHGDEPFGGSSLASVWRVVHDHFIMSHNHKLMYEIKSHISGSGYFIASIGHLSDVKKLDYARLPNWQTGFVEINFNKNGNFKAQLHPIIDGEIF